MNIGSLSDAVTQVCRLFTSVAVCMGGVMDTSALERQKHFVVMADISGYSRLSEDELVKFHTQITPEIGRMLDRGAIAYINTWGDAIVFSGLSCVDVCRAAVAIRNYFRDFPWGEKSLPDLTIRISLHTGYVFIGTDPIASRGLIFGQNVIAAARVEPLVKPGQIWATDEFVIAAAEHINQERSYYHLDFIGDLPLPKSYGIKPIYLLRHRGEPKISELEKSQLIEIAEERVAASRSAASHALERRNLYTVAVGVVVSRRRVLLVQRRDNTEGLEWMFPSGVVLPLQKPETQVWREVQEETGVSCTVVTKLGSRNHPATRVHCDYFQLCPYNPDAEPENLDSMENAQCVWMDIGMALERLGGDLLPEVTEFLEASRKNG